MEEDPFQLLGRQENTQEGKGGSLEKNKKPFSGEGPPRKKMVSTANTEKKKKKGKLPSIISRRNSKWP